MKKNDDNLFPQEAAFRNDEADAWFERNRNLCEAPISPDHRVITALRQLGLKEQGALVDLGGGPGALAAGVLNYFPGWSALTIELSNAAILAGKSVFPNVEFRLGSITSPEDMPSNKFDLTIVSGVLCWVDRSLLAQSIANIDSLVADGGLLLICDFSSPYQKANKYHHREGLFTYKQNYAHIFTALGVYTTLYHREEDLDGHNAFDESSSYDTWGSTTVLKKDLLGRFSL